MKNFAYVLLILHAACSIAAEVVGEGFAKMYLHGLNQRTAMRAHKNVLVEWNYLTNMTKENHHILTSTQNHIANETKAEWMQTTKFVWKNFINPDIRRQFERFSRIGVQGLPYDKLELLNKLVSKMRTAYTTTKICSYENGNVCDLKLEPDLINIMATSRNPHKLEHIWTEWRKAVGGNFRENFKKYVDLMNEAANVNNKRDASEMWLENFEIDNIKEKLHSLWLQIKPLYLQLHAYIRYKLGEVYGDIVPREGPIPAHLLGNMWAQTWDALYNFTAPYPEKKLLDVTNQLKNRHFTPIKLLRLAESFFVSLNFSLLPQSFWDNSMIEEPSDRDADCHPSSWDFFNGQEFRIKACIHVNENDYITAHYLLAQIYYFIQYKNQPHIYKDNPADGFIFGLSKGMTLPITTGQYLRKIDLLKEKTPEDTINILYLNALQIIPLMPFGYIVDLWRWNIFSGKISSKSYNCKWWELRNEIQGVQPPVERSELNLDPLSKYHIAANQQYIQYFVSSILQFQIYKNLCITAGEYNPKNPNKPLHVCDISENKAVGDILQGMMELGASKPLSNVLDKLTGEHKMDANAIIEYFSPVMSWLSRQNEEHKVKIGWGAPIHTCRRIKQA